MKIKTAELLGSALAYAVGVAEGCRVETWHTKAVAILFPGAPRSVPWNPHSNWAQGGPIIERDKISIHFCRDLKDISASGLYVHAEMGTHQFHGYSRGSWDSPLIAAMRCYVASKLGNEVDVPEELL